MVKKSEGFTPDFDKMIEIVFWNSMGFFFYGFLMAYVSMQILHTTGVQLGITFSAQIVGGVISGPIAGVLTDKIAKKKLVLAGSYGRAICYILTYIAIYYKNYYLMLVGVFTLGFGAGLFWTPFDALVSQKSSKEYRSLAFGKRGGKIGTGNLVGTLISVAIFTLGNYIDQNNYLLVYSPLILYAITNIYGGTIFSRHTDESIVFDEPEEIGTQELSESEKQDIKEEIRKNNLALKKKIALTVGLSLLMLGFIITRINQSLTQPLIQGYIINNLEDNPTLVMFASFPGDVLSQLFSPYLGDKADKIEPVKGMAVVSALGALNTWILINTGSLLVFAILLVTDMTLSKTGELILQNYLSRVSKQHRGKIFGIRRSTSDLGGVLGPLIGGVLWDTQGMRSPFILSIYIELSLIIIMGAAIIVLNKNIDEKVSLKNKKAKTS
jgi:MFS family permease